VLSCRGDLVKYNSGLDGTLVLDRFQRLAILLELEGLVDDALGLDLSRVEVVDSGGWNMSVYRK
jgi:hypothetical protein